MTRDTHNQHEGATEMKLIAANDRRYLIAGGKVYRERLEANGHYWEIADKPDEGTELPLETLSCLENDAMRWYRSYAVIDPNYWEYNAVEMITRDGFKTVVIEGKAENGLGKSRSFAVTKALDPKKIDTRNRLFIVYEIQQAAVIDHYHHTRKAINYPNAIDDLLEVNGQPWWMLFEF